MQGAAEGEMLAAYLQKATRPVIYSFMYLKKQRHSFLFDLKLSGDVHTVSSDVFSAFLSPHLVSV